MIDRKDIRLLAVCCTFRRPERLSEMLSSFYATKSRGTELVVYLQEDDPRLDDYREILVDRNYVIGSHLDIAPCFAHLVFNLCPGLPYYHNVCDDYVYETPGWDNILIENLTTRGKGYGFACGQDMFGGKNKDGVPNWNVFKHPTAEVYSWEFINKVGYLFPPGLTHFGPDYYLKEIGEATGGTIFCPEVIIRHVVQEDENTKKVYDSVAVDEAYLIYQEWRRNDKERVIRIICEGRGIDFNPSMLVSPEGWE